MNASSTALDLSTTPYLVRPMQLDDLEGVMVVERSCFSMPWPASAFRYDLTQNNHAHYVVVAQREAGGALTDGEGTASWWQRFWRGDTGRPSRILAYGGFWCLVDEAHIANIAVAPTWRGRGLGELMLVSMLDDGVTQGMQTATLEVRVSNGIAQNLYRKYGFEIVGRRKRYYSDNYEDALIMSTGILISSHYQQSLAQLKRALLCRLKDRVPAC
jgi:[ribosomal protein S18]-alanine N-acetyltransferase